MSCIYPDLPEFRWKQERYFIGLTGGIGSGKSTARQAFADQGAFVIDADQIAHQVLESPAVKKKLLDLLGTDIVNEQGQIRRSAIAGRVFQNPELLAQLNALVHPAVHQQSMQAWQQQKSGTIGVYDVPLLFEKKMQDRFDCVIVITADLAIRQERACQRDGWDSQQFMEREQQQIALSQKEKQADLVIRNNASADDLGRAIQDVYQHIRSSAPG